ncbi:MAG: bifunctional 3-(3-hydroxy-phenyl)propionate/3-hydroxycinnamic acid hydroxylase [Lautropia sp.]
MSRTSDADTIHDVAIIGCGPTGATLANLLAMLGVSVLVLEREPEIYALPRAIHFDGECMRVFQTIGIAEALHPQLLVSPGMKFVDAENRVLIDWSRPQAPGAHAWHASYRFHQPVLERVLRTRMAVHPNVTLRLRHDVFSIEPHADHVQLRMEDTRNGRLGRVGARYVVGCDGARSLVRRFMGTELDDLRSHERWLVLDVLLRRPRPDLGDHSIQFCDPRRPSTYVRGVGDRRRWELMLMPGDDPATITRPEHVWPLLSRWVTPDDATLERPAVYTFHSVVARGWRSGRMLIAGDAAHQTPPFMGQGMCAGIRDASNLAWKLAAVLRGDAPVSLLDTYERERSPHVREFIDTAVRLGGIIQATDPALVERRNAEMTANPRIFHTPQPALGPGAHDGGDVAGQVAPQPLLDDGTRLDDRVGYRFLLLVRPELLDAARSLVDARAIVVPATPAPLAQWLAQCGAAAVLVRPDRYVAGVATDGDTLAALVRRRLCFDVADAQSPVRTTAPRAPDRAGM